MLGEPPLVPTPDEARSSLREELLRPEYHETNLVARLLRWLQRQVDRGLQAAADLPSLSQVAAVVVLALLVTALAWLLSRARRTPRARPAAGPMLGAERLDAAQLRARAEAALAAGRPAQALVDAFRSLAVRQVERGRLDDAPGATAHEVARALEAEFPDHRAALRRAALLFDEVLYGHHPATAEQARSVLDLDDRMAVLR